MPKFRKKPVVIEAVQVTSANYNGETFDGYPFDGGCPVWLATAIENETLIVSDKEVTDYAIWEIHTLEGVMFANPDDWIIQGVEGELYPCKPDIFDKTYEQVEE